MFAHQFEFGLAAEEYTTGVDIHDAVPLADSQLIDPTEADHARVVDRHIQAAKLRPDLLDQTGDALRFADINLQGHSPTTQCLDQGGSLLCDPQVVIGQYQVCAGLRQAQRNALANATTSACYQGNLAGQGEIHSVEFAHVLPLSLLLLGCDRSTRPAETDRASRMPTP